jgi:hypothetical protein
MVEMTVKLILTRLNGAASPWQAGKARLDLNRD